MRLSYGICANVGGGAVVDASAAASAAAPAAATVTGSGEEDTPMRGDARRPGGKYCTQDRQISYLSGDVPVECVRFMPVSLTAARGPGTVCTGAQRDPARVGPLPGYRCQRCSPLTRGSPRGEEQPS